MRALVVTSASLAAILLAAGIVSLGAAEPPAHAISDGYRGVAARIVDAALRDDGAMQKLQHLTDFIGNRIAGSPQLDAAIAWATGALLADGEQNVHTEKVMVPHWVRGEARAELLAPVKVSLRLLALGSSPGTPARGLTAPVVVVHDYAALEALGAGGVRGKIVLFDHPMTEGSGAGYDAAVEYRNNGPSHAAKLGAAAALVRSVTPHSLGTPHTGRTVWAAGVAPIPAAAISVEDAALMSRLAADGAHLAVHLYLGAHTLPEVVSANVIAELRGRELPDEIVLLGAHLDSWDVGEGAHDDGAGCVTVMQALALLRKLGLTPRRTIRVVLYTNEENGVSGGKAYLAAHHGEVDKHVAAIEADSGGFQPEGFSVEAAAALLPAVTAKVADAAALLSPVGATHVAAGETGADVEELANDAGVPLVPLLGLDVDESTYFDVHHTVADTFDKIDKTLIARNVAAMAVMAYVLADMPGRL